MTTAQLSGILPGIDHIYVTHGQEFLLGGLEKEK